MVFTADAGVLSNTTAVTDGNGEASTFLTTDRETIVTAREQVGGQRASATVLIGSGPVASFTFSKTGLAVTFNASASTGAKLTCIWDFGDNSGGPVEVVPERTRTLPAHTRSA